MRNKIAGHKQETALQDSDLVKQSFPEEEAFEQMKKSYDYRQWELES
jgi:hypothetical protein